MLKLTRWTIAHRRIVVVAWIVLAVGVLAASQAVGKRNANIHVVQDLCVY